MSRIALFGVWLLCIAAGAVSVVWMLCAIVVGSGRAWRLAVAFDRVGNAATGGLDTETISDRAWRWKNDRLWARWLVALVETIDPDHFKK